MMLSCSWPPDPTIGTHPDPNKYYLRIAQRVLRFMRGTDEYKDKEVFVFWASRIWGLPAFARMPPFVPLPGTVTKDELGRLLPHCGTICV